MRFRNPFAGKKAGSPVAQRRPAPVHAQEDNTLNNEPLRPGKETSANPYLRGREEWNERYGSYIARAKNWRLAAFGSIGVSAILAIGMVHLASESRVEPYVVTIRNGEAVAVGPAQAAPMPSHKIIAATLAEFIQRLRIKWPDPQIAQRFADETYGYVARGTQAEQFLNIYLRNKFSQSDDGIVDTPHITSVSNIGKNTWQIDWQENITNADSTKPLVKPYQAIVHIKVTPPTTEQEILKNPLGIYVTQISWNRVL